MAVFSCFCLISFQCGLHTLQCTDTLILFFLLMKKMNLKAKLQKKIGSLFMLMFNKFSVRTTLQCTYRNFFFTHEKMNLKNLSKITENFLKNSQICPESCKTRNARMVSFGEAVECWNWHRILKCLFTWLKWRTSCSSNFCNEITKLDLEGAPKWI